MRIIQKSIGIYHPADVHDISVMCIIDAYSCVGCWQLI